MKRRLLFFISVFFMLAAVVSAKEITVKVADICQAQGNSISSRKDCNIKEGTVIIFKCSKWWPEPVKIFKNGVKVAEWSGRNYSSTYQWTAKKNARIKWAKYGRTNPYIYISDSDASTDTSVICEIGDSGEDSQACKDLIAKAQREIDELPYDESKSLSENKAAVDAILAKLDKDLAAQRQKDAQERMAALESAFDSYKANRATFLDGLIDSGSSQTCKSLVADAKAEIASMIYDLSKPLEANKDDVDAKVSKCQNDITTQIDIENREKEAKYSSEYSAYKMKRASDCELLSKDGDSDKCQKAIDKAKSDIYALAYKRDRSLDSNKADVDYIYTNLSSDLQNIRKAEADAIQLAANKLTFESFRSAMLKAIEPTEEDDDAESQKLINKAMTDIKNIKYDESLTLNQNKAVVEDVITPLSSQLASLRMKNAVKKMAANKEAFEKYKKSIKLGR